MITDDAIEVVPANMAGCADLAEVFGTRGDSSRCHCQRYKLAPGEAFSKFPASERAARLREQTHCGEPSSPVTSGLIAYLDGVPVGWCAVEPRPEYFGLTRVYKVPWEGRQEDRTDASVWAVTCVLVRTGYRGRGVAHRLVAAAVDHARRRGARAIEGYPMITRPGLKITYGEIHPGTPEMFAEAGFAEVHRPTHRRLVMRIDF